MEKLKINTRKHLIKSAGILSLCLFPFSKGISSEPAKPNILMILVDDHGYGDLSITGGTDIQTPHLDKLFQKGVKFTNFYSNCTVCSPTRASLMTGRYPDLVGVFRAAGVHLIRSAFPNGEELGNDNITRNE